ncbi:MAG: DUF1294 domain-containing protein, partial [Clostridia bacterium]|nr:DUF1294 domain-containing protein [Clostridia bacterium]
MENFKLIYLLWIYLLIVNLITFILYAVDKRKARKDRWRIKEKTLISWCFAGG